MFIDELKKLGFNTPTPIQQEVFSHFGKGDIVAKAKTGSGKTLAFVAPIVVTKKEQNGLHTLIIAPTRELALQIQEVFKALKSPIKTALLIGGEPISAQQKALESANVIIGTPGRLIDMLSRGLELKSIDTLVLDEADRMLDMGFRDEVLQIVKKLPQTKQGLFFSATYKDSIESFAKQILNEPLFLQSRQESALNIKEYYIITSQKEQTLLDVLAFKRPKKAVIFAETKDEVFELFKFLKNQGLEATYINGNLEQTQRFENITLFKNGSKPLLVATDLASRGLDIKGVDLIINYTLPFKKETYTHRIGRTARADAKGEVVNIIYKAELAKLNELTNSAKELKITPKELNLKPKYATIKINAGKRRKIRAGDIIGTLCKNLGLDGADIGDINIDKECAYIALNKELALDTVNRLNGAKIKKQKVKAWLL